MCGVTGWVDWRRDLTTEHGTVDAMTDTLAARGPDARGTWSCRHAALGHRRLAVIDVEGGVQPMVASRGDRSPPVVLTFSGEVYNFRELGQDLRSRGHRFRTRSDTEVVLRAYLEWGADCVRRFDGMFAFGIWDEERQELLLARDRLGVKPLYYHPYEGGLVFGSEPKAILANPLFDPVIGDEGLVRLFAMFGTHEPGHGVLGDLYEIRPGWTLTFDRSGASHTRYWSLESRPHHDGWDTTVDTVRGLLTDAVRSQLVSDVPLCALVSGGLDSSAVAALASNGAGGGETAGPLSTFSVDFTGNAGAFVADADRPDLDAPFVRTLVAHLGTAHQDVVVDPTALAGTLDAATHARDHPCLGDLDGSLYLLFQAIQGRSTVALSGESADEVFGGYAWFHDGSTERHGFPWSQDDLGFANVLAPELKERLRPAEYVADRYASALAEVPRLDGETAEQRRHREVGYLALTRFLPVLLDRKDRMSMAVGLEVRVPFCDHRLVEYVWNTPWAYRCRGGKPKALLRSALTGVLPADLVDRRKSMFPVAQSSGYDGAVRAQARALVDGDSAIGPYLDPDRVRALADGSSKRPPWMQRLALAYLSQVDGWLTGYGVRVKTSA